MGRIISSISGRKTMSGVMYPRGVVSNHFTVPSHPSNMMPGSNVGMPASFHVMQNPMQQSQFQPHMGFGPGVGYGIPQRPPPTYTPHMAQSFHSRQRQISVGTPATHPPVSADEMRERERQMLKMKEYQAQKMKLQSFATTGSTKVDADKLIEHMFGKRDPQHKPKPAMAENLAEEGESFGEFLGGTPFVTNHATAPITPHPGAPVSEATVSGGHDLFVNTAMANMSCMDDDAQSSKDLSSMMLECSDLSVPSKPKTFHHRPSLKEVHRKHSDKSLSYHQSNTARNWTSTDCGLDGLFVLDEPKSPTSPTSSHPTPRGKAAPPPWMLSHSNLPPVYNHVKQACMVDGQVSTDRLYPIMLMSGLSRDVLGQVWMMVNKTTPGQLTQDELVKALAIIALMQNKIEVTTSDILSRCPTAPIPMFNNPVASNVGSSQQQQLQQPQQQQQQKQPFNSQGSAKDTQGHYQTPHVPALVNDEDFSDFQAAVSAPSKPTPPHSPVSLPPIANPLTTHQPSQHISNHHAFKAVVTEDVYVVAEERHSNVSTFFCSDDSSKRHVNKLMTKHNLRGSSADDDFDDFKSAGSGQLSSELSENEDFKTLDSYVTNLNQSFSLPAPTSQSNAGKPNIPDVGDQKAFKTSSISTEFGDFNEFKSAPSIKFPTISQVTYGAKLESDRKNQGNSSNSKNILGGDLIGDESNMDKYSALKSLDETPYTSSLFDTPIQTDSLKESPTLSKDNPQEDDWADFQSSRITNETPENFVSFKSHVIPATNVTNQSVKKDEALEMFNQKMGTVNDVDYMNKSSSPSEVDPAWVAAFDTADPIKSLANKPAQDSWGDFSNDSWGDFTGDCENKTAPNAVQTGEPQKPVKNHDIPTTSTQNGIKKLATEPPLAGMDVILQAKPVVDLFPAQYFSTPQNTNIPESRASKSSRQNSQECDDDFDFTRGMPPPIDDTLHHDDNDDFGEFYKNREPVSPIDNAHVNFASFISTTTEGKYKSPYKNTNSFSAIPPIHADEPPLDSSPTYDKRKPIGFEIMGDMDTDRTNDYYKYTAQNLHHSDSGFEFGQNFRIPNDMDVQSIGSLDLPVDPVIKNISAIPDSKSLDSLDLKLDTFTGSTPESKSLDSLDMQGGDDKRRSSSGDTDPADRVDVAEAKVTTEAGPKRASALMTDVMPLADRYAAVSDNIPGSEMYTHEWERCMTCCYEAISQANTIFNSISSSLVCNEVIKSQRGTDYVTGLLEIYRVSSRIVVAMDTTATHSSKLEKLKKDIDTVWNNLAVFIVNCSAMSGQMFTDYRSSVIHTDDPASRMKACGLCLLDVDMREKSAPSDRDNGLWCRDSNTCGKLNYSGRQYHSACANFWVNRVDSTLPILRLPDLL